MSKVRKWLLALIIPALILVLWWLATSFGGVQSAILPSIEEVGRAFARLGSDGTLWKDLSLSITRVLKGYAIASILGLLLGTVMGMSPLMHDMLYPTVTAVRQIPYIAWIPLIILWCGIGELSKVVVICIAAFFPVTMNTMGGMMSVPGDYLELAALYRMNRRKIFLKISLPHALPQILIGLKLGMGSAWMAVVASELIASSSGIGYRLSYARGLMQSDVVLMCMICIGIVGILMDKVLTAVFARLLPWERGKKN